MVASSKKPAKSAAKKAVAKKPATPKAAKVTAAKTIVVGGPTPGTTRAPRHRTTGEKYQPPKIVRKPTSRDEQAAQDNYRLRGQ